MKEQQLENPVLGYVVIAAAILVGMLSVTVFGQTVSSPTVENHPASTISKPVDQETSPPPVHRTVKTNGRADSEATDTDSQSSASPAGLRRWILGVRSTATTAGHCVTSVVPGSPAAKFGIRVNDRILTVNGRQVGWLDDELRELHRAIDASETQTACLLVHRRESRKLMTIRVRLTTLKRSLGH